MSRFNPQQVANLRSWGYEPRPDEIIQEEPAPKWEPWRLAAMQPPESLSRWEQMAREAQADITVQAYARQADQHNAYVTKLAQLMGVRNR